MVLLLPLFWMHSGALAQGNELSTYEAVVVAGRSEPSSKALVSMIVQQFPNAEISFLKEPTHLLIQTSGTIEASEMGSVMQRNGLRLLSFTSQSVELFPEAASFEDFPIFISKDGVEADADAYGQAKAAWVESNPDGYLLLLNRSTRDGHP